MRDAGAGRRVPEASTRGCGADTGVAVVCGHADRPRVPPSVRLASASRRPAGRRRAGRVPVAAAGRTAHGARGTTSIGLLETGDGEWTIASVDGTTVPLAAADWRDGEQAVALVQAGCAVRLRVTIDDLRSPGSRALLLAAPPHTATEALWTSGRSAQCAAHRPMEPGGPGRRAPAGVRVRSCAVRRRRRAGARCCCWSRCTTSSACRCGRAGGDGTRTGGAPGSGDRSPWPAARTPTSTS